MTELARLDRTKAKVNPRQAFASPSEIVDQVLLTRGEKLAALETWRLDVLTEMSATDEGMPTHGVSERLSIQLREIDRAVGQLAATR